MAPTSRDHAPAAQTTVSVAILPEGCDARDAAAVVLDGGRRAALEDLCAARDRRGGIALHDGFGTHVPVARAEGRRENAVELELRDDLRGLGGRELERGDAVRVLHCECLAERLDVARVVEQEEIAHLVEGDRGHELDVLPDQRVPALELVEAAE